MATLDDSGNAQDLMARADKFVSETWTRVKNAYWVKHQRFWEARLFYAGQFWFDFDIYRKQFTLQQPNDDFVPQPRINRFSPAIDSIASNFASIPEVEAVPVPQDDETSMGICEVINELTKHCIKDNALRSDYKSDEDKAGYAAQEFVLSGCCFTQVYPEDEVIGKRPKQEKKQVNAFQCLNCDIYQQTTEPVMACPKCGQPVQPETAEQVSPVLGEDGQPVMEDVIRKKIIVKTGDPGHEFPRLGARNMGESPFHIWAERFTLDEIRKRWKFEATPDALQPDGFSVVYDHALSFWLVGFNAVTYQANDAALVIQCYIAPDSMKDYPEGLYAVMIGEKVIYAEPWPFVEHPLTKGDYMQLPSLFFPRSVADDLVELQRRKCIYESIIELHAKTSAVDPMVIHEDTVVTKPTGKADKIIYWRSIAPGIKEPHRMGHGVLDPEVYAKVDKIDMEFDVVSAASSVFRGEQPGSVTAASAIETLRGQAEMRFAKPVQNWNNLWKETIRKVIKNYQKYLSFPELVQICGADKTIQVQAFIQADIDKCCEFVATNNGLPRTRDERRQEMIGLFDKGIIDPADPNVRQKIFELFGETGMMKTFNDDARRARVNVSRIKAGQPAMFRAGIDDPLIHMGIALEAAKNLDFDQWLPQAQQMLLGYIESVRAAIPPPVPVGPDGKPAPPEQQQENKPPVVQ